MRTPMHWRRSSSARTACWRRGFGAIARSLLAYQGRIEEALDDCVVAERLATAHEQYFLAGGAAHNHAFAAGLQGDIVTALASFVRADSLYEQVGYPGRSAGVLASDRCELMLAAGLNDEARANAEIAVRALSDGGDVNNLAEARLLLARACLAQGDVEAAHREAQVALGEFRRAGRDGWAAMAEYIAVRALQVSSVAVADRWTCSGRPTPSPGVSSGWGGRPNRPRSGCRRPSAPSNWATRRLPDRSCCSPRERATTADPIGGRALGWQRRCCGAPSSIAPVLVERSLRGSTCWPATRRRSARPISASVQRLTRGRLAELGLEMALDSRRPRDVLVWAERVRANALSIAPVRPPADSPLATALGELRRLRADLDESRRALTVERGHELAVARMEATVRDLARTVRGGATARERFSVHALMSRLDGDRQLVEYVDVDGTLAAVVVTSQRCTLRLLGPVAPVASALEQALFSLTRLARSGGSDASRSASMDSLQREPRRAR